MNCKDCIHDKVCDMWWWAVDSGIPFVNSDTCKHFKDKFRIVELPCKVGDKYYRVSKVCSDGGYYKERTYFPTYYDCENCCEACDKEYTITNRNFYSVIDILQKKDEIGTTVFLSKEEAEQALKERENNA